jgi:hypothetical protein
VRPPGGPATPVGPRKASVELDNHGGADSSLRAVTARHRRRRHRRRDRKPQPQAATAAASRDRSRKPRPQPQAATAAASRDRSRKPRPQPQRSRGNASSDGSPRGESDRREVQGRMPVISELGRLLEALEGLVGKTVAIDESISRDRHRGHDRHWSTSSHFEFVVRRFSGTISGGQLALEGQGMQYAMAAFSIAEVSFDPLLVICERFEQRTERKTTLRVLQA